MKYSDPDYVLEEFKKLIYELYEEMQEPTKGIDLNEKKYKSNLGVISNIRVSDIYCRLSCVIDNINKLKSDVAVENGFDTTDFNYTTHLRGFCNDYQDVINIAVSLKQILDQNTGLIGGFLGLFRGYNNPVETVVNGHVQRMNYQQLHNKFSYQAALLQESQQNLMKYVAKDIDDYMMNFN